MREEGLRLGWKFGMGLDGKKDVHLDGSACGRRASSGRTNLQSTPSNERREHRRRYPHHAVCNRRPYELARFRLPGRLISDRSYRTLTSAEHVLTRICSLILRPTRSDQLACGQRIAYPHQRALAVSEATHQSDLLTANQLLVQSETIVAATA
jgi:hypothetical protein